jgi:hypothetical protein
MITSKSNVFIKSCIQLKEKKFSKKLNKCLVESYKLVKELYLMGLVDTVVLSENKVDLKHQFKNVKIEVLSSSMICCGPVIRWSAQYPVVQIPLLFCMR